MTIVSCAPSDWEIVANILARPGMRRLGNYCVSFQGEVNETHEKKRSQVLFQSPSDNRRLVLRGANVCLYVLRDASQGEEIYIDAQSFWRGKDADSKSFHSRFARIGFQRSAPQNNFRRIIAAYLPAGEFCFDTISYVPESHTRLPLDVLLALLNSKLLEWYFRLGSTNSKVNEYQFNNLPCPAFRDAEQSELEIGQRTLRAIEDDPGAVLGLLAPLCANGPFSVVIQQAIAGLSQRIRAIEGRRGHITRNERAHLAPDAQAYQNVVDQIIFALAGLTQEQSIGLEERLQNML